MQVLVMGGEEHFVNHKTSLTPRNDFQYSLQFVSARPVEYIPQRDGRAASVLKAGGARSQRRWWTVRAIICIPSSGV
jgi:hypothetical protein